MAGKTNSEQRRHEFVSDFRSRVTAFLGDKQVSPEMAAIDGVEVSWGVDECPGTKTHIRAWIKTKYVPHAFWIAGPTSKLDFGSFCGMLMLAPVLHTKEKDRLLKNLLQARTLRTVRREAKHSRSKDKDSCKRDVLFLFHVNHYDRNPWNGYKEEESRKHRPEITIIHYPSFTVPYGREKEALEILNESFRQVREMDEGYES